jgi:hypothetical protein
MSQFNEDYLEKCANQRAAIMATLCNILVMPDDNPLKDAKLMIASSFKKIIENDHMVGDVIDRMLLKDVKSYLEQEQAYRAASSIVNPENPL